MTFVRYEHTIGSFRWTVPNQFFYVKKTIRYFLFFVSESEDGKMPKYLLPIWLCKTFNRIKRKLKNGLAKSLAFQNYFPLFSPTVEALKPASLIKTVLGQMLVPICLRTNPSGHLLVWETLLRAIGNLLVWQLLAWTIGCRHLLALSNC